MFARHFSGEHMPAPVPTEKLTDAYKTALRRFSQVEADDPMLLGNLATSMGACRLFGVDLGSIDCTLTVEQGVVVAGWLRKSIAASVDKFQPLFAALPPDINDGYSICSSALLSRMFIWGVMVVLDEAEQAGVEDNHPLVGLLATAEVGVLDALDVYDRLLNENVGPLSILVASGLLDNWRSWLLPEFADEKPWWLDGRLEQIYEEAKAKAKKIYDKYQEN
jgi:hypothetical protein